MSQGKRVTHVQHKRAQRTEPANYSSFNPLRWLFCLKVCALDQVQPAVWYQTLVVVGILDVCWPCCLGETRKTTVHGLLWKPLYRVAISALNAWIIGLDICWGYWQLCFLFPFIKFFFSLKHFNHLSLKYFNSNISGVHDDISTYICMHNN